MSRNAIAFFSLFFFCLCLYAAEKPFWLKKPDELPKLLEGRKIPVSVKSTEQADKKHHLRMQGIGEVSAPFQYSRDWLSHFDHLKRVGDYAREVKWNPVSKRLYFHTEAFGYHARMRLKLRFEDSKRARDIHLEVVQGVFQGMKCILRVEKNGFAKSHVSLDAHYYYKEWLIPQLFLEFGLEVVLQKFSERLRTLIEKDFKAGQPAKPTLEKKK